MIHVLVADADADIRATLYSALTDEGHCVATTNDATLTLSALWVCRHPLVVLLNEHLGPLSGWDVLELAAEDKTGRLSRHGYIVMTTAPWQETFLQRRLREQMSVPILAQPFDLDDLYDLVHRADTKARRQAVEVAPENEGAATWMDVHVAPLQHRSAGVRVLASRR